MKNKRLESDLAINLFDQMGEKSYLTEAGKEMYPYGRVISQQLAQAREVLEQLKSIQWGQLTLSAASTAN